MNAPIPEDADEYVWQNALQSQPAVLEGNSQSAHRLSDTPVLRSDARRREYSSPPEQVSPYRNDRISSSSPYPDSYGRQSFVREAVSEGRQPPRHQSMPQPYYEDRIPGLSSNRGAQYYDSAMHSDIYADSQNWQYGESSRRSITANMQMPYSDMQRPMMASPGIDRGHPMPNSYSPQRPPSWDRRDDSYSFYRHSTC